MEEIEADEGVCAYKFCGVRWILTLAFLSDLLDGEDENVEVCT